MCTLLLGMFLIIMVVICCVSWYRNELVYKIRINMLEKQYSLYDYLPTYDEMYNNLRVWTEKGFIKIAEENKQKSKNAS